MANVSSLAEIPSTLYVHVGTHKTGTTAIQKFLYDNKNLLADKGVRRLQVGVPEGSEQSWGHHQLAWALQNYDQKSIWKMAAREAMGSSAALISSEEFSLIRKVSFYDPVRKNFSHTLVRPICYLRRQDKYLESVYNHHVKSLGEVQPIMEFAKRIAYRLDYGALIQCLADSFGGKNIILRTYDRNLLIVDIFQDFLDAIGIASTDHFIRPEKTVNAGLSAVGLKKMLEANKRYAENPIDLKKARVEIMESYSNPSFTEHHILTPSDRETVLETFTHSNNHIAEVYLGRKSMF